MIFHKLQLQLQQHLFTRTDILSHHAEVWRFLCSKQAVMPHAAGMDSTVNLYQARPRSYLKVASISGGWGVRRNLNQMGLHVGDEVSVIRKAPFGGPLVVESRGNRLAIGKQLAEEIKVEAVK